MQINRIASDNKKSVAFTILQCARNTKRRWNVRSRPDNSGSNRSSWSHREHDRNVKQVLRFTQKRWSK